MRVREGFEAMHIHVFFIEEIFHSYDVSFFELNKFVYILFNILKVN